jgi:hypothetical protein
VAAAAEWISDESTSERRDQQMPNEEMWDESMCGEQMPDEWIRLAPPDVFSVSAPELAPHNATAHKKTHP